MRTLILLALLLSASSVRGQFGNYCRDSLTLPDPYYQCGLSFGGDEYNPVCGCDQVTYRNACAAIHWGGLLQWTDNTICGSFHIDLRPTIVEFSPIKFQAFIRNTIGASIPISIYIYDNFGKLEYSWFDVTRENGFYPLQPLEIPAQDFERGIYILAVIVNDELQTIRFAKVNNKD